MFINVRVGRIIGAHKSSEEDIMGVPTTTFSPSRNLRAVCTRARSFSTDTNVNSAICTDAAPVAFQGTLTRLVSEAAL